MNPQMKQTIRPKIESYVKRAEEIKDILKNGPTKKKAVADTANGRGNSKDNKGDDDDSDPDKKRMMQKFEGIIHTRHISLTNMIFDC
jgi:vacuolar protein-sorting-associated protein 4